MTVKKALGFGLLGIPIGIAISTTIALAISLFFGSYSPVSPPLIDLMGGLMNAALFQYLASVALGFICGFGSAIWAVERWSLLRKTLIHFLLLTFTLLPISIACRWVAPSFISILIDQHCVGDCVLCLYRREKPVLQPIDRPRAGKV